MITSRSISAIKQRAREMASPIPVEQVLETLHKILPLLGSQSHSRQMVNRIGYTLLTGKIAIVAPSCPDYAHHLGQYTFAGVGGGVPLLAQVQIALLERLAVYLPKATFEIVVADQEADDSAMCHKVRKTREEMLDLIEGSVQAVHAVVASRGWSVHHMTERFPELRQLEGAFSTRIAADASLEARILSSTISRQSMYAQIGTFTREEMIARTVRVAAQYCAMAHLSCRDGFMICNHETVNLSWYTEQGATVLHNAVSVY